MKPYLLISMVILLAVTLNAQDADRNDNLVVNYSFEEAAADSITFTKDNSITAARGWSNPNEAEPDIYSTTSDGNIYDEYGSLWPFKARSGKNVAAIHVYGGTDDEPKREYVQGSLSEPLTVGQTYEFSFWVHYHCEGANNIGIVFLPKPIQIAGNGLIDLEPAAYQVEVTPYTKSTTWAQVTGTFKAYQPYTHFMVGNFFSNAETELESRRYNHYFAYIDDIVVRPIENLADEVADDTAAAETAQQWEKNIENLNTLEATERPVDDEAPFNISGFDQDCATLPESSLAVLDKLAETLLADPTQKVLIQGYASSEGSEAANHRIAARRCHTVKDYLHDKGVTEAQIRTKAIGEQNPIADNSTPAGRKANRRVEILVE